MIIKYRLNREFYQTKYNSIRFYGSQRYDNLNELPISDFD